MQSSNGLGFCRDGLSLVSRFAERTIAQANRENFDFRTGRNCYCLGYLETQKDIRFDSLLLALNWPAHFCSMPGMFDELDKIVLANHQCTRLDCLKIIPWNLKSFTIGKKHPTCALRKEYCPVSVKNDRSRTHLYHSCKIAYLRLLKYFPSATNICVL